MSNAVCFVPMYIQVMDTTCLHSCRPLDVVDCIVLTLALHFLKSFLKSCLCLDCSKQPCVLLWHYFLGECVSLTSGLGQQVKPSELNPGSFTVFFFCGCVCVIYILCFNWAWVIFSCCYYAGQVVNFHSNVFQVLVPHKRHWISENCEEKLFCFKYSRSWMEWKEVWLGL